MKTISLLATIIILCSLATAQIKAHEEYVWDFNEMCSMDTLGLWVSGQPGEMRLSDDAVEGANSLEVDIDLDRSEYMRIEHNFIDGFPDVGKYIHGLNAHREDMNDIRTIRFAFKNELDGEFSLMFRLWDRKGGWLEWRIPRTANKNKWWTVTLHIPSNASNTIDLTQTGGVLFELQAFSETLKGKVKFDNLEFLEKRIVGTFPLPFVKPSTEFSRTIHSQPIPDDERPDVHVIMFAHISEELSAGNAEAAIEKLRASVNRFRGMEEIEFWYYVGEYGMFADPDNAEEQARIPQVRKAVLDVARWCEKNKVKFYQGPGHITPIFVKADFMKEILQAAPNYCLGVFMHEYSPEGNNQMHEMLDMLELLYKHKKKLILNNQTCYWFSLMDPNAKEYRDAVFSTRYKNVFVPMWENLLPSAQGLCAGGCLGFWRAGRVNEWGLSAQSWMYANQNYGLTDEMPGHLWFRMFLTGVAFGATYIEIEPDWPFNGAHLGETPKGGFLLGLADDYNQLGWWEDTEEMKALRWFMRLLRHKAIVAPSEPKMLESLSDAALQVTDSNTFMHTGILERGIDKRMNQSHCPTSWEASCHLPRRSLFRKLYRSMHYYDQTIPETPFGFVSILPPGFTPINLSILQTDGRSIKHKNKWLEPEQAELLARQLFMQESSRLPFAASGCLVSAVKLTANDYQLMLVDPEERFPTGIHTILSTTKRGKWQVVDNITAKTLGTIDRKNHLTLDIPAGGFKVLRIRQVK